jgi:plasmid stability protein
MATTTIRLDDALYRLARIAAASRGQSLNLWVARAIQAQILHQARGSDGKALAAALDDTQPTRARER